MDKTIAKKKRYYGISFFWASKEKRNKMSEKIEKSTGRMGVFPDSQE
jgi:hypothetical protein